MARTFTARRGSARVVFGAGASRRIGEEIAALGMQRVLVVSTPGRVQDASSVADRLGARSAGVLAIAKEHVPADVAAQGRRAAADARADGVLAFGGGSAIGLAKAIALEERVRVAAIPTTYAGSEMTPIWGITDASGKKTGRDERVRPVLVVYDPELLRALPRDVAVASAWNAMAHAVEALWSSTIDRATFATAEQALELLASSVARLDEDAARERALEGAYLAALAFADAGSGVHHRVCHLLGGAFAMPHAATHAALLPRAVRAHRATAPEAMAAIARALGVVDPVLGIERLARATGVLRSLASLGMPRDGVERVVAMMPADADRVRTMLEAAADDAPARPEGPALRGPATIATQPGFGAAHESEALEGALPRDQNAPKRLPYGLYPELLNGTPFTVKNAENSRVWLYRIRPSFSHSAMSPLPSARFAAPLEDVLPNRTRWRPLRVPQAPARADFLDGLVTLGGAGDASNGGPAWRVHLYAANADMIDRSFSDADGDLLIVPQEGTLDCRTELGWLRVAPGSVLVVPRAIVFAIGLPDGAARGWVLEVSGRRLRLPERGLIGSNGLADARHFRAPVASFEDRACPGFQHVTKFGGRLFEATREHSPFDVVAWHGNHAPFSYDLSLFAPMASVKFDHQDPSIFTVLTAPLDDHGRAIVDFVAFVGRWEVIEHSFRPPFMHRNAASEINMVVRTSSPEGDYQAGCTFLSPLLTPHGVSTKTYDEILAQPDDEDLPHRIPDESLWAMFESALPFRATAWARTTPELDASFLRQFEGMRSRFDPQKR